MPAGKGAGPYTIFIESKRGAWGTRSEHGEDSSTPRYAPQVVEAEDSLHQAIWPIALRYYWTVKNITIEYYAKAFFRENFGETIAH